MICRRCEVGWASAHDGRFCWVCGDEGQHGDVGDIIARPHWMPSTVWTYVAEEVRRLELGEVA